MDKTASRTANGLITKNDLVNKLKAYTKTPDDDVIRIKEEIKNKLISCPELLYALHEQSLESELFDAEGNINRDSETLKPLGNWNKYFGDNANILPYLFVPSARTDAKNYICYQTETEETVSHNLCEKKVNIIFTIFVHSNDKTDELTNIPRHDLIASVIRENFAWIGLEIPATIPIYNKESITENNYLTRIIKYECILPNSLVKTENGITSYNNKR